MKKETKNKLVIGIVILAIIITLYILINLDSSSEGTRKISLVFQGEKVQSFCEQVCADRNAGDLTYSLNDTRVATIACECSIGDKTSAFYFNSKTGEELN